MFRKNSLVPFIGLALVAALSLTGCSMKLGGDSSEPSSKPSATASAKPSPTTKPVSDTKDKDKGVKDAEASATLDESLWGHLTWKYPTRFVSLITKYNGAAGMTTTDKVTRPTFTVGSTLPGRVWTDSVRPPIVTKTMEEVDVRILTEPDYGWQVCSGLAHSSITGGKSLLELNSFLKECYDPASINVWSDAVMSGSPAEQLVAAKKLALVVMLLEQLNHESVGQHSTWFNYNIVVGQPSAAMTVNVNDPENTAKVFELNPIQYVGEFIIVQLTFKGQTGCWLQVGFNTGDGRFAGFACETPKPPSTPSKPPTVPHKPPVVPPCQITTPKLCPQSKDAKVSKTPPQGWTQQGPDAVQAPIPAKTNPLNPATPVTADSGLPVGGASTAPSAPASPGVLPSQQSTSSDPNTPVVDAG
jgi:hypothetical protein